MPIGTGALLGAAGIGAAANLIGNIFGKKSNDSANATNMKIAQMNNEWSEKMMDKQNNYNIEQWNREKQFALEQRDYDSAANQVQRLKEAGLNPALMMGSGAAGSAASTPSGNSVGLPSPSQTSVKPFTPDFSGIGAVADSVAAHLIQKDLNDAQIRMLDKQTAWYDAKAQQELAEASERTNSYKLKNHFQKIQNNWANQTFGADYYHKIRQGWSEEANARLRIKQSVLTDKQIMRYDEETNARIADLVASTGLKYAQGELSKGQLKNVIEDSIGKSLSNKEKEAIFDYVLDKASADRFKGYTPFTAALDAVHGVTNRFMKWLKK